MIDKNLFPPQYDQIVDLLRPTGAYLVGGAVRDMLLKRQIHDLDFALPENPIGAAKRLADQLGGGFFILDSERQTSRVILKNGKESRLVIDFTLFQGSSIEEDLASRDFTITSMALDIRENNKIIDLFHGAQDLMNGLIRMTSRTSLEDDPLRCLRAVRLATQLGFQILPDTKEQIRRQQGNLVAVSPERKRDEFFRLLDGPNQSTGIQALQLLGVYPYILPGDLSPQTIRMLRNLEIIWSLFINDHDQERAADWGKGLLVHRLGRYRKEIRNYVDQEMVPGRTQYHLSFIIPLIWQISKDEQRMTAQQISELMPLSNQECNFIEKGIQAVSGWLNFNLDGDKNQPIDVYRYFRDFGRSGVVAVFLGLGELLDKQDKNNQKRWIENLDKGRYFLEGYWEHRQEWVDPPALLDGYEIQVELGIPPGPAIGSLLEILLEEQVRGGILSKEEGLEFLKSQFPQTEERKV